MYSNIIEVKELQKIYKITDIFENMKGKLKVVGIENATFSVTEGEVFAIIGLNGAGKTTIMKCILGMIKADRGSIKVFGKQKLERVDYYGIGYLPEISYYPKEVRLKDIIDYYADLYEMSNEKRKKEIPEILEMLEIHERKNERLEKFSKGMLQRVGIVQAIMNKPKLLFLDEPMSGLDPLGQKLIYEILLKLKKEGTTIVLNTHILSDVEKLADRIAIVHKRKVIKVADFKDNVEKKYEIITFDKANCEQKKVIIEKEKLDEAIKIIVEQNDRIVEIKEEYITLEKIFLELIS